MRDADLVLPRRGEAEECGDVGSGLGRGQELLELINDEEDLARTKRIFGRPGEDSVTNLVGLAGADKVGKLAGLDRPCAGAFRRGANTVGEATERIGAGTGLDDVPDGFVGPRLAGPAEAPAAKRRDEARQHQRGFPRPAVAGDQQERCLAQEGDQLIRFLLAAEEEMRRAAVIG